MTSLLVILKKNPSNFHVLSYLVQFPRQSEQKSYYSLKWLIYRQSLYDPLTYGLFYLAEQF